LSREENYMNRLLIFLLVAVLLYGCKKSDDPLPEPTMEFLSLNNVEVKDGTFQRVDLGEINSPDFTFSSRTITDQTLNQTKFQFFVTTRIDSYLMLTTGTQSGKKFTKGDSIRTVASAGSTWSSFTLMILAQKITPAAGASYWDGEWKDASHHFLPIKITRKNGDVHVGWIELSMDIASEKVILHRAAISIDPEKNVRAGD